MTFFYVLRRGINKAHFTGHFVIPFEQRLTGLSPDERTVIDAPRTAHVSAHTLWEQGHYELSGLAELWRN